MSSAPRIVRTGASPLQLLAMLQQADRALAGGDVAQGRWVVGDALSRPCAREGAAGPGARRGRKAPGAGGAARA
jgi:hypothetical protein